MALTAKKVERTKTPGRYRDSGGDGVKGLLLQITHKGAKSWVLRYELNGRERMMGIGSAFTFTLAQARERARAARRLLSDGVDPLTSRQAERAAARLAEERKLTFKEATQKYFDQHEAKWRSARHREQFINSLSTYAFPVLGSMDVATIETADVLRAVEPVWKTKAITADRVRSRIEQVLDWAVVRGHRPPGTNAARWKGHLDQVLPAPSKLAPTEHHPAMDYREVPAFVRELRAKEDVAARALEFLILCAARTGEVIPGATWSEIDFQARTWTVPGNRMKKGKEHRVPLSEAALALLKALPREKGNPHLFIGSRSATAQNRRVLLRVLRAMGQDAITVHGFRSSFRDWAGETTAFPHDVCEAALAHVRGDATVKAYARGDLFEKRRKLMEAWAAHCAKPAAKGGNVVAIKRASGSH
jgi:integrase